MEEQQTIPARRWLEDGVIRPMSAAQISPTAATVSPRSSPGERAPRRSGPLSGRHLDDYRLGELLGVGGMAEVYQAEDLNLRREVAIKVLSPQLAEDTVYADRFRDEARRAGSLSHPRLVPLYHSGEVEIHGQHLLYLVMPLLRESLRDLRLRTGKLPTARAAWLILQVADGLEIAHQSGIVHRDAKPGNVLLDAQGHPLLTDFGIACELCATSRGVAPAESGGLIFGTPGYMTPEQLLGAPIDQRADVYALGAVFYELLTGQLPFVGATPYELADHVLNTPLIPPSVLEPDVTPLVEEVVLTALERDPKGRYTSAGVFALALRSALISRCGNPRFPGATERPLLRPGWQGWDGALAIFAPCVAQENRRNGGIAHIRRPGLPHLWQLVLAAALVLTLGGSGAILANVQPGAESSIGMYSNGIFEPLGALPMIRSAARVGQIPAKSAPATGAPPAAAPKPASGKHGGKHSNKHGDNQGDNQGENGGED
jgi:Protein kinase domain